MKIIKKGLRVWLTIASVFTFLGGWIILSHSNKPAPLQISQPAITAPSSNNNTFSQFSSNSNSGISSFNSLFSSQNNFQSFSPRIRTGGS